MGIDRIKTLQNYAGIIIGDQRTMLIPTVMGTASYIKARVTATYTYAGVAAGDPNAGTRLTDAIILNLRHKTGHQPLAGRSGTQVNILNSVRTGWDVPNPALAGGADTTEELVVDIIFPYVDPRKGPNARDFCMPVEELSELDFALNTPITVANSVLTDIDINWDILFDPDDDTIGLEFSLDFFSSPTPTPILTGNSQKITDVIFQGDWADTNIWLAGAIPTCSLYQEGEPINVNATFYDYWQHFVFRMEGYGAPDEYTAAQGAIFTPIYTQAAYYSTVKVPTAQYQVEFTVNPAAATTIDMLLVRVRPFSREAKRRRIPLLASIPPSVAGAILKPKIPFGKFDNIRLKPTAASWLPIVFQKAVDPKLMEYAKTIQREMALRKIPNAATGELLAEVAKHAPKAFFM